MSLPRRAIRAALAVVAALAVATPSALPAQVVRGTVTERTTEAPLVGVVVELTPATGGDRVASALTDPAGGFALRAPTPGRYVIAAKRIGVKRWTSAPFELAAGESRSMRIVLEALDYRLPEVVVTTTVALCTSDPADASRASALWEEARTALDATRISLRDKLFSAEVTRYARELDPRSRRVVSETRSETRAVVASPFRSAPAESLSAHGYWEPDASGKVTYHAPDAEVLQSDVFLHDHCFRVVEKAKGRNGLIGLAFAPTAERQVPDITGAFWLDAKSFELRLVDFNYSKVRDATGIDSAAIGGEVHFTRLANGAWLVRRWSLRFPTTGRPTQPLSTEGSTPWLLVRPNTFRLAEEGGLVVTDDQRAPVRPATLEVTLKDSTGKRPLANATVKLAGTSFAGATDSGGKLSLAAIPPGEYRVTAELAGYAALGMPAADQGVSLGDGETRKIELVAADMRALTVRLCKEGAPLGYGTVLVTVRDGGRGPVGGASVSASWRSGAGRSPASAESRTVEGTTNDRGTAALCIVAADREVKVSARRSSDAPAVEQTVIIKARSVHPVEIQLP